MRAQQFTILRLCRAFSAKEVFMKQHLMRNINTISRCAALYRDAHLADCGLSGWQAPYIPEICAAPGITQDQLALRLHVNRSNVTRQLAMLEENGFVLRRRSESDRRAVEVYPTQKAEETLSAVRAVYRSWREKLFYDLTSEERDRLESLLERLARRGCSLLFWMRLFPPERWAASFSGAGLWCSAQRRRWAAT